MMTTDRQGLRLRTGGSLPLRSVNANLSVPFVVVTTDGDGITFDISPRWMKRLVTSMGSVVGSRNMDNGGSRWHYSWDKISHVNVAHRSLILMPKSGRPCRIVTLRRNQIKAIVDVLAAHEVPSKKVFSTFFGPYRASNLENS